VDQHAQRAGGGEVRLTELEPQFVRYEMRIDTWTRCLGDHWKDGDPTEEITGPREHTIHRTADAEGQFTVAVPFAEAQGIQFLCPLCFAKNNGPVGTHGCDVTFADRGVPDQMGSHNKDGQAVRWTVSGDAFENLTTTPSILLEGGCAWHGFITNGAIT
jgi:hypothetical protein